MFSRSKFTEDNKYFVEEKIADFVPISCHYDDETLLTKNGELCQTIEIDGFETNDSDFQKHSLRSFVRKAIKKYVKSNKFAIYIHVIRSRKNMQPKGEMPYGFADDLNNKWCKKNNWDNQLVNTLYITIVSQSLSIRLYDFKALIFSHIKKKHLDYLKKTQQELTEITDNINQELKKFGSQKLKVVSGEDAYYSQPLAFYFNLIHLKNKPTLLPIRDLSEYLANVKFSYKFNTIQIEDIDNNRLAAVFTIKQAHNLPIETYDKLLQIGCQFTISEMLHFVDKESALKSYKKISKTLEISKSKNLSIDSDLENIINAGVDVNDYCVSQVNITIYSDEEKFFSEKINKAVTVLNEIGLVVVREDFNMVRSFLAQIPGNFKYNCRTKSTATSLTGAFTSIHHKNMGCYNGSKWGPPVTIFRNIDGNPFYFNFHDKNNNGNTLIIGPMDSGKTVLMNFFLAQATKLKPRIIYIDIEGKSANFIEEIGGIHVKPELNEFSPLKIYPFELELFDNNLDIMQMFLNKLIYPSTLDNKQYEPFFKALLQKILQVKDKDQRYNLIKEIVKESQDASLKNSFEKYFGEEIYGNFFNEDFLDLLDIEDIICVDLSLIRENKHLFEIFLTLFIHKLTSYLNSEPTIIAINKANSLFINEMAPLLPKFLDKLSENNSIAFFSILFDEKLDESQFIKQYVDKLPTKIFLSDKFVGKHFKRMFELSEWEFQKIKSFDKDRRVFLVKQESYSILGNINLSDLNNELEILK